MACHLSECAGTFTATLKVWLKSCIISSSSPVPSVLNCIGRWIFLASDAVRSQPWTTLCTATPNIRVILKGWGRGRSLVLSPLPVMVQRGLHLTIMLMLWIPLLSFLIFTSSFPRSASPSASYPPWHRRVIMGSSSNLADDLHFWRNHYFHFQHVFIFITVIAARVNDS